MTFMSVLTRRSRLARRFSGWMTHSRKQPWRRRVGRLKNSRLKQRRLRRSLRQQPHRSVRQRVSFRWLLTSTK